MAGRRFAAPLLLTAALLVLPACKSVSTGQGAAICLAESAEAAAAAFGCGAASPGQLPGFRRAAQPAATAGAPVTTGSVAAPQSQPHQPVQAAAPAEARPALAVAGRNQLALPPFLRNGEAISAALPARPVFDESKPERPHRRQVSLHEAVTQAALLHPEIKAAEARVREAKAGIDMSRAPLYPQGDTRLALGGSQGGNAVGRSVYERANPDGNARVDASVSLKQLIFDFGATRADVERASYLKDSEQLKLLDKVDDIVLKTAQAYLKILETRALLALVDETVIAHRKLAGIVQANQREGNGTAADVNRVNSRLTDMNAIRSDVSLQLAGAEEQFHRLTRIHPGALTAAPSLAKHLPASPEAAVELMRRNNPRLASMTAQARAVEKEIDFQRASALPKVQLEADSDTKNYAALNRHKNETEARALITFRYKFMDGGLANATVTQLNERRSGSLHLLRNEDEQTSADIRQAFRAVDSARRKGRLVAEGVQTSAKVQELYLEQFKAGRRTVFELLDSQMSSFTARRSAIESRFEAERAVFDILRHSGKLAEAMARAPITAVEPPWTGAIRKRPTASARSSTLSPAKAAAAGTPESFPVSPERMPKRLPEAALARSAAAAPAR